jgi:hypothetical protein
VATKPHAFWVDVQTCRRGEEIQEGGTQELDILLAVATRLILAMMLAG